MLVVDDHEDTRSILREVLESDGCRVTTAADGGAAIHNILGLRPDAIVLDLSLPILDGLSVASFVRGCDATRTVPIVAFTARSGPDVESGARAAGCSLVLTKPMRPRQVAEAVKSLLWAPRRVEDLARAGEPAGPDPRIVARQLDGFRRRLPEKLAALEAACFPELDLDTAIRHAHSLAGSAGTYGLWLVCRRAQRLETALRGFLRTEIVIALECLRRQVEEECRFGSRRGRTTWAAS